MRAIDFVYDGLSLSSYKFIVCEFDYASDAATVDSGSQITFEKVAKHDGKKHTLVDAIYEDCYEVEFDIIKDPDKYDGEDRIISDEEYTQIARWLNRREFLKFNFVDDERTGDICYFNASFNLSKIEIGGKLYGIHLSMETDAPFGYGETIVENNTVSEANGSFTINDKSDEIGYIYPDVTITCNQSGKLEIRNSLINCKVEINNCSSGEIIHLYGDAQIIETSVLSHKIQNDFNFQFLKIGNTFSSRLNTITVSLPCTIEIQYEPIIKNIP